MQNPINFGEVYAALEMLVESSGGEVLSLNLAVVNPAIMRGSFEIRIASEEKRKPTPKTVKPAPGQLQIPVEPKAAPKPAAPAAEPEAGPVNGDKYKKGIDFSAWVLVDRMLAQGMIPLDVSSKVGGSRASGQLSEYMHGKSRPSKEKFLRICEVVGVTPTELKRPEFIPASKKQWRELGQLVNQRRALSRQRNQEAKALERLRSRGELPEGDQ